MAKRVLDYNHIEARRYFLKEESYCNFLPDYFIFQNILNKVSKKIEGKSLSNFYGSYTDPSTGKRKTRSPRDFENVNYKFLENKDGKFSWRPIQLIHPALYVSLVHKITEKDNWKIIVEKFKEFENNPKIKCYTTPIESESNDSDKAEIIKLWWKAIEQQSIELALEFEYVLHTDISNCYGSIYTHSIAWALHSKVVGKTERKNKSLIGNIIDQHLRDMSYGQTNGIPQGSILMHFIAEMVLGYVDLELAEKLKVEKLGYYKIIRYRDDYRVFSNNPQDAELIVKNLTEVLVELGMSLNAQKTLVSHNVIRDSIKPGKLYLISNKREAKGLQEQLLLIHEFSQNFPNSGSLNTMLSPLHNRIQNIKKTKENVPALISILVDIAYKNPTTYPVVSGILSNFLSLIGDSKDRDRILNSITTRFSKIPNTGHIQVWLQRVTLKIDRQKPYNERLCKKLNDSKIESPNTSYQRDGSMVNLDPAIILINSFPSQKPNIFTFLNLFNFILFSNSLFRDPLPAIFKVIWGKPCITTNKKLSPFSSSNLPKYKIYGLNPLNS